MQWRKWIHNWIPSKAHFEGAVSLDQKQPASAHLSRRFAVHPLTLTLMRPVKKKTRHEQKQLYIRLFNRSLSPPRTTKHCFFFKQ